MTPEPSSSSPNQRRNPFLQRNENIRQSFDNPSLSEHVCLVLDFIKTVNINLPILLWAISWNIPDLVSDPKVSAERTALMVSDELSGILAHWWHPPWKHNSGIRTKAAYDTINICFGYRSWDCRKWDGCPRWCIQVTSRWTFGGEFVEHKMERDDGWCLSQGSHPTTWTLFCHAAYTQKQESRNTRKNPDTVSLCNLLTAT